MRYTRGSDIITVGTVTVDSGTADTDYPASNLIDLKPNVPAKLTTTTGSFLRDLLTDTLVNYVLITHHNLSIIEVRLQGNATNTWATPSVDIVLTIAAPYLDLFPVSVGVDLETLVPVAATRTKRYWRIKIVGTNAAPVSIGEWTLFSATRTLDVLWGDVHALGRPDVFHETEVGVQHVYDIGTTVRGYGCEVICNSTVKTEIETWFRSTQGRTKPVLIIPDNFAEPMLMRMNRPTFTYSDKDPQVVSASLEFAELNKGMYP